ncbi:RHS repeat-associated core domain-containing protein [Fibrobacter sp. UWH3]|uniref:RHS repeat domain-containing protein n=1 Tax=Fibrobacter sp. UWH3 TaxID=1964353 RepID=UPI000B5263C1|nr:RHS repeat-associated core domain-containing protein [Fibrobacter sp. UWH3]OWV06178.1 hypothetical protein B7993_06365 [Fibrobacter sp. UWH3]
MPVEFLHETGDNSKDYKLLMAYDGSGRRISKTRYAKDDQFGYWYLDHVTHYTGIGTEVREAMRRSASPKPDVVVNMPQGLGRYGVERYSDSYVAKSANENTQASFEWFLKNHIGSTMLVYGTQTVDDAGFVDLGSSKAAYDYRAFGEQVSLMEPADKVTETFTGKERDDETELNYFGARYLDPMLGLWISVDPARQFSSPYLYAGNGVNPVNVIDPDGNKVFFHPSVRSNQNFKNEFSTAIQYLNKGGVSGTFAWLQKRPEKIYIAKAANGEGSTIDYDDDMKAIVINWNPNEALVFPEGTQSPALGVLHEGFHAKGFLKNPSLYMKRFLENDDQYDNKEERRVIEGPESWAAEKLGESIRFNHGGEPVYVEHSDELPE